MIPPILITGAARSGTSLVAGVIDACGAFGGNVHCKLGNPNNAKGFFENRTIISKVNKQFLKDHGWDMMGQNPLPSIRMCHELAANCGPVFRDAVETIMKEQGYKDGPWYFKDPKTCLVWPIWNAAFPDAKWVFTMRLIGDIADSCMRTGFMSRYKTRDEWITWAAHHLNQFTLMEKAGMDVTPVWPGGGPLSLRGMVYKLGLKWCPAAEEFFDPDLWH